MNSCTGLRMEIEINWCGVEKSWLITTQTLLVDRNIKCGPVASLGPEKLKEYES